MGSLYGRNIVFRIFYEMKERQKKRPRKVSSLMHVLFSLGLLTLGSSQHRIALCPCYAPRREIGIT